MSLLKITSASLLLAALPALASTHHAIASSHGKKANVSRSIRHTSSSPAAAKHSVAALHHEPVPMMAPERATAIQSALIKAGYLQGEPSGAWDAESNAAMAKFQADNDWQTKFTPDARALNKLGLGGSSTPEVADAQ